MSAGNRLIACTHFFELNGDRQADLFAAGGGWGLSACQDLRLLHRKPIQRKNHSFFVQIHSRVGLYSLISMLPLQTGCFMDSFSDTVQQSRSGTMAATWTWEGMSQAHPAYVFSRQVPAIALSRPRTMEPTPPALRGARCRDDHGMMR
ncbi:MAG: hypothetical protein RLZZ165_2160 [Bacteroidota bacterium]